MHNESESKNILVFKDHYMDAMESYVNHISAMSPMSHKPGPLNGTSKYHNNRKVIGGKIYKQRKQHTRI